VAIPVPKSQKNIGATETSRSENLACLLADPEATGKARLEPIGRALYPNSWEKRDIYIKVSDAIIFLIVILGMA
jgi:hypothetical protein